MFAIAAITMATRPDADVDVPTAFDEPPDGLVTR